MAVDSGLKMEKCRLGDRYHFMTKRFDRIGNKKLLMQTLGALAHIDYNYPGLCSYESVARILKQINPSIKDVEELYRRMVFNVIMVNQDDHVKNISFLMNRDGSWKLAPAFDVTFSYNLNNRWLKSHQMLVNGKGDHIVLDEMIAKVIDDQMKNDGI